MKSLRPAILTILFAMFTMAAFAQTDADTTKRTFGEATYITGGLGLSFGSITNVQIQPGIGYKIDDEGRYSAGVNLLYWYFRNNTINPPFEVNTYGYGIFNRNKVIEGFFTYAEFQSMSLEIGNIGVQDGDNIPREWVPFLFLGGGYAVPLGGNTYLMAQLVWEVIGDPRSPYIQNNLRGQPIYGVSIGSGF